MNCQEFWNTVSHRGHELNEEQAQHVQECARCAADLQPQRSLSEGLDSLRDEWRQTAAPDRVEAGLVAAFRANGMGQVRRPLIHTWYTPVLAWTAAAAAMFILGTLIIHGPHTTPSKPEIAAPRHAVQSEMAAVDTDTDDDSSSIGEGFVQIPNAPKLEPNEPFDVVQLEVPSSAVVAWGLPMADVRGETVLADVALATDGTMRAVRLVPDGGTY